MVPLKTACRRDVLYWLAVSFTFALATAAGDLTAGQLHFGFVGSIVLFAIVMAMPALGCWRFHLNSVLAFWWAYITTRPLGASVADWVSKPVKLGGLSYGDGPVAAVLLVIAFILVTFVATRRSNVMSTGAKSPALAPKSLYCNASHDRLAGGVRVVTGLYSVMWFVSRTVSSPRHRAHKQYGAFQDPLIPVYPWAASPDRIGEARAHYSTPPSRVAGEYSPSSSRKGPVRLPRCSTGRTLGICSWLVREIPASGKGWWGSAVATWAHGSAIVAIATSHHSRT